jgi:hypothetical protein
MLREWVANLPTDRLRAIVEDKTQCQGAIWRLASEELGRRFPGMGRAA